MKLRKYLYITLGTLTLVLGALGLVLPILPTTPFWLLTAYLYTHSSPHLYERAMRHPIFGGIVRSFQLYKAIPLHVKVIIIVTLWSTILLSIYLTQQWWIALLLIAIAIGVTLHILSYRTLTPQLKEEILTKLAEKKKKM